MLVLAGCEDKAGSPYSRTQEPSVTLTQTDVPQTTRTDDQITTTPVKESTRTLESSSGPLMTAFGNEPFWSVAIHLDVLMYKTPESPGWVPVKAQLTEEGNGLRYTGKLEGKDFILVINRGACSDGMSDTVHQFKSALTIGKETHQGCARPG
ncbi:MAG: COG3650 family protein [Novosphingobium sp.]